MWACRPPLQPRSRHERRAAGMTRTRRGDSACEAAKQTRLLACTARWEDLMSGRGCGAQQAGAAQGSLAAADAAQSAQEPLAVRLALYVRVPYVDWGRRVGWGLLSEAVCAAGGHMRGRQVGGGVPPSAEHGVSAFPLSRRESSPIVPTNRRVRQSHMRLHVLEQSLNGFITAWDKSMSR